MGRAREQTSSPVGITRDLVSDMIRIGTTIFDCCRFNFYFEYNCAK
jgi:hypothetical protein